MNQQYGYPLPQYGGPQPPYQLQAQQLFDGGFQNTPVQGQLHAQQGGNDPNGPVDPGAPGPEPNSPDEDEEDEDQNQPIFNLPPPPEDTHASEPALEAAIHAWSLEHGYELVRRASKKNAKGVLYKRYYHCSKHGRRPANASLPAAAPRQRVNRKSARTGCPMSIACVSVDPNNPEGEWQVRHRKSHHNHGPLEAIALAGHRRRARVGGVEQAIDGLFSIGSSTAQVLQFLQRTHPNGLYTRTDVANMKLKWKRWGTCADRQGKARKSRDVSLRQGIPAMCTSCSEKRWKCDSQRPRCGYCIEHGKTCIYGTDDNTLVDDTMQIDEEQPDAAEPGAVDPAMAANTHPQAQHQTAPVLQQHNPNQQPIDPNFFPRPPPPPVNQRQATEQILANLQTFEREHIAPVRLTLQSSSVEVMAQSSCGLGDSFRSVLVLFDTNDWPKFRDAMLAAAMRENTYDVLIGEKVEPEPISANASIEEWNERIRQQAIFNRRNAVQLSALWDHVSPSFRQRIRSINRAADAWSKLEETCLPRGSEQAYRLYLELHSTTLESSGNNLHHYISSLTSAYEQFCLLKLNTSPPATTPARRAVVMPTARQGSDAVPEEMACFLFLKGLGPAWATWVTGLLLTNNVGGFGTGERLGLKELGKRALGYQAQQRVNVDGGR